MQILRSYRQSIIGTLFFVYTRCQSRKCELWFPLVYAKKREPGSKNYFLKRFCIVHVQHDVNVLPYLLTSPSSPIQHFKLQPVHVFILASVTIAQSIIRGQSKRSNANPARNCRERRSFQSAERTSTFLVVSEIVHKRSYQGFLSYSRFNYRLLRSSGSRIM